MAEPLKTPRRRMPPEDRRAQLLDTTAEIVLAEGFGAVSIDRVARTAGVARTVVYAQFGSLDGLLLALVERTRERLFERLQAAVPALEGHPDPLLFDSIRTVLTAAWQDPQTWRLALFAVDTAPPELKEAITAGRDDIHARLRPLLAWGLEHRGTPDVDADLFTRTVIAAVEGAIKLMLDQPEIYPLERILAYVGAMLGIVVPR